MTVSSSVRRSTTAAKPDTNIKHPQTCSSTTTAASETDKFAALAEEALKNESISNTTVGSSSVGGKGAHQQQRPAENIPFVGREAEMGALHHAVDALFDSSTSDDNSNQEPSVICVSGPAGTGKSHLLQQLRSHVLDRDGYFLTGKFSSNNGTAYAGLSMALQDLVDQILHRDLDMGIRRKLEEHILPEDAAILVEIFPALSRVLSLGHDSNEGDVNHFPSQRTSAAAAASLKKSNSKGSKKSARNLAKSNSSESSSNSQRAKQRRFLFLQFIRVLLSSQTYQDEDTDEHDHYEEPIAPVVLVLDDVQWMDAPSCDLISALVKDQHEEFNSNKPFLLLASSRVDQHNNSENRIGEEMILWKDKYHIPITHLHLENLTPDNIHTILESFLGVSQSGGLTTINSDYCTDVTDATEDTSGVEEDSTQRLADIIFEKTKGNAFFVIEFIKALLDQELLTYNYGSLAWKWNTRKVKSMVVSENYTSAVVDLLTVKLNNQLSPQHQFTLIVATFLGGTFDQGLMQIVLMKVDGTAYLDSLKNWQKTKKSSSEVLEELVLFGFLNKTNLSGGRKGYSDESGSNLFFFCHDLVRQAAADLMSKAMESAKSHLLRFSIGESILNEVAGQERSRQFENGGGEMLLGVELCNSSSSHLGGKELDVVKLAKHNLLAGEKAMRDSAFASSKMYMEAGVNLLEDYSPKQREYHLYEDLLAGATEANYCAGNLEDMATFAEKALAREGCRESVKLHMLYFKALASLAGAEFQECLDLCAAAVSMLGLTKVSSRPTKLHVLKELIKTKKVLKGHTKETLQILPLIDPVAQENRLFALKFFDSVDPAAYVQNKNFVLVRGLISLRWAVKYGISRYSANGFAIYGLLQQALYGDLRKSAMFGTFKPADCSFSSPFLA